MNATPSTARLLFELDRLSRNALTRRDDLATLLDTAALANEMETLDGLSFLAKFVVSTHGIMARIGPGGTGYDALQREFSGNLEKARSLLQQLIARTPQEIRPRLEREYLALSADGLQNLLALYRDLSWYKNYLIDTRTEKK